MRRFLAASLVVLLVPVAVGAAPKGKPAPKPAPAAAPAPEAAPPPPPPPAAPPPPAPAIQTGAPNAYLEEARKRASKGQFSACLEELDLASGVATNSVRQWADLHSLRATCSLLKPVPDNDAAKKALVEFLHYDPKGDLTGLPDPVRLKLEEVKVEKVVILHERLVVFRTGRPIKIKAKVNDPQNKVAGITLSYRVRGDEAFKSDVLERGPIDHSGYIRVTPLEGQDNVPVEYYLIATDAEGTVLDVDGNAARPVIFTLSSTLAEEAGAGMTTVKFADESAIKPPPPPVPAFYERWWFWTVVGALVIGGTTTAVLMNQPEPQRGTLGDDLPSPGRIVLPLKEER